MTLKFKSTNKINSKYGIKRGSPALCAAPYKFIVSSAQPPKNRTQEDMIYNNKYIINILISDTYSLFNFDILNSI